MDEYNPQHRMAFNIGVIKCIVPTVQQIGEYENQKHDIIWYDVMRML